MPESNEKTVYVLGAGFSAAARIPMQAEILERLLDRISYSFSGIVSTEVEKEFQEKLSGGIEQIREFIESCFPTLDQPLEDIFTLLDQTIQSKGHFAGYGYFELLELRDIWLKLICGLFHAHLAGYLASDANVYQRFAAHLLETRMRDGQQSDPVSVISLNWDSLLEESFFDLLGETGGIRKADIDHCVYTTPLDNSKHIPSTKQKAAGLYNLKVLKLHGSISWLRCPNSNHLYTALGSEKDPYELYLRDRPSPFIAEKFPDSARSQNPPLLEPYIITPTYTKVFDQPHIQTTWHNAYVELREASRIVFVGYSLPEADYHFRTLLRRAIRTETEIEVILYKNDREVKLEEIEVPDDEPEMNDFVERKLRELEDLVSTNASFAIDRYRRLFGSRVDLNMNFEGVAALVDRVMPGSDYPEAINRLHESFKSS